MGSAPISYQPLLSGDDDGENTLPTRGRSRITIARSSSARPLNSSRTNNNGGGGGILRRCRSGDQQAEVDNVRAILKRCQTAPGYVSFDDVLNEAFGRKGRSQSAQLLARLQAGDSAYEPPRQTRRGSFMHRLVSKYLSPCLDFLASAFNGGS